MTDCSLHTPFRWDHTSEVCSTSLRTRIQWPHSRTFPKPSVVCLESGFTHLPYTVDQRSINPVDCARHSPSSAHFSGNSSDMRRQCIAFPQQRTFGTQIIWEHLEKCSGLVSDWKLVICTPDHVEVFEGVTVIHHTSVDFWCHSPRLSRTLC